MHPAFSDRVSRPLRAALVLPAVYLCLTTPFAYGFEPRESSVGANFVLGVSGAYGTWLALIYGFVADRTPFTYIGVESDEIESGDPGGKSKVALRDDPERLAAIRRQSAAKDSPLDILRGAIHLLFSMRATGYVIGPSAKTLKATAFPATPLSAFIWEHLKQIAWSHVGVVVGAAILTAHPSFHPDFLSSTYPSIPSSTIARLYPIVATPALGIATLSGLTLGYSTFTLSTLLLTKATSFLPLYPTFEPGQYHRLFNNPAKPQSVSTFWARGWHTFLAMPFKVIGMNLTTDVVQRLGGSKILGRALGVMAVFTMSGFLHEQALHSATYHIPPFDEPLSFLERWGCTVYFLLQGVAVLLEQAFTASTGRKVGGLFGAVWTSLIVLCGGFLVWRSW
ncbi:hypothetical protein RQP46_010355 [Phenoliferia psychrophenolica]